MSHVQKSSEGFCDFISCSKFMDAVDGNRFLSLFIFSAQKTKVSITKKSLEYFQKCYKIKTVVVNLTDFSLKWLLVIRIVARNRLIKFFTVQWFSIKIICPYLHLQTDINVSHLRHTQSTTQLCGQSNARVPTITIKTY